MNAKQRGALLILMPLFLLLATLTSLAYLDVAFDTLRLYKLLKRTEKTKESRAQNLAESLAEVARGGCYKTNTEHFCLTHSLPELSRLTPNTQQPIFLNWPQLLQRANSCQSHCAPTELIASTTAYRGSVDTPHLSCARTDLCTLVVAGYLNIDNLVVTAPILLISSQAVQIGNIVFTDPTQALTIVSTQGIVDVLELTEYPNINIFATDRPRASTRPNGLLPPLVMAVTKLY